LGWKLASVIKGKAHPKILRTYQQERYAIAMRLLAFDKRMVECVCGTNTIANNDNRLTQHDLFTSTLHEENTSASGLTVRYTPNLLVTPEWDTRSTPTRRNLNCLLPFTRPQLAANLIVGARFPSAQVLCQSDSRPWHLQHVMQSMGQWNLIVFGGDISQATQMTRVQGLSVEISNEQRLIHEINQQGDSLVGKVETYLVHSAPRRKVEYMYLPKIFRPFDKTNGYDYWKIFADNDQNSDICGSAYRLYGIGAEGCIILLRPDQHVSFIGTLEDLASVEMILANIVSRVPGSNYRSNEIRKSHDFAINSGDPKVLIRA
jgi:phenol 2-monooxygenase